MNIPILSAVLPVSAPFEVSRPKHPLVLRQCHRKTLEDGTSGERVSRALLGHGRAPLKPLSFRPSVSHGRGAKPEASGEISGWDEPPRQRTKWHLHRTRTVSERSPFLPFPPSPLRLCVSPFFVGMQ